MLDCKGRANKRVLHTMNGIRGVEYVIELITVLA